MNRRRAALSFAPIIGASNISDPISRFPVSIARPWTGYAMALHRLGAGHAREIPRHARLDVRARRERPRARRAV